jgi:hypothetical protein
VSGPPRALLVVENEFLSRHVGVRRVIGHYWARLDRSGYDVDLAVAEDGILTTVAEQDRARARAVVLARHPGASEPFWTSARAQIPEPPAARGVDQPEAEVWAWRGDEVAPGDYQVSVLTNPWMCARDVPPDDFTHGIVYDLVPNLVSAAALDLREFVDVNSFAHEHQVGYEFYEAHARTLACISESTRRDLLRFYLRGQDDRAVVDIPFEVPPTADDADETPQAQEGRPARVLLVNALDQRKNITGIRTILTTLARERPLSVSVVGRERMPWHSVRAFFSVLAEAGITVEWFRGASDDRLNSLYRWADVLLFPSLYEGLGLPILEAQQHGLPVVSSSTSSCGEINLNSGLTADPLDLPTLVDASRRCLDRDEDILRGGALRAAVDDLVMKQGRGLPWGLSDAQGESVERFTGPRSVH